MADDDAKLDGEDGAAEKPKRKKATRRRKKATARKAPAKKENGPRPFCGLVMPISPIAGRDESHWKRVRGILTESLDTAGFDSDLVSNSDEVTVIHSNIVENLYDNEIVVCDVSGKNPNVMLELGMRLAFDNAVVIVKDDDTEYSFDSAPIEHIPYPRSLRYDAIVEFKAKLAEKVEATHAAGRDDPEFSPFLKHFKRYKTAGIQTETVDGGELNTRMLKDIQRMLTGLAAKSFRQDGEIRVLQNDHLFVGRDGSKVSLNGMIHTTVLDSLDTDSVAKGVFWVRDSVVRKLKSELDSLNVQVDAADLVRKVTAVVRSVFDE